MKSIHLFLFIHQYSVFMKLYKIRTFLLTCVICIVACNDNDSTASGNKTSKADTISLREENVTYNSNGTVLNGFLVYDASNTSQRPAVLVVHEWWGLNEYVRTRAKQLAMLGYIALAVDMFGNGNTAANPQEAMKLAGPFYQNPNLTRERLQAAIDKIKTYDQTDTGRIAAIGYCYGGFVVLNAAKLGADLDGVVVFHGGLAGAPVRKDLLKSKILVCHGESDGFIPQQEIDAFKKSMDSIGADYTFKSYPDATHAFTNPDASETGKKHNLPIQYNAAADSASWNHMKDFLGKVLK